MHRVRSWAITSAHGPARVLNSPRADSPAAVGTSTPIKSKSPVPKSVPPPAIATAVATAEAEDGASPAGVLGAEAEKDSAGEVNTTAPGEAPAKPGVWARFKKVSRGILFYSWVNVLLVFVPVGIAVNFAGTSAGIVFAMNAIAIIPLAGLLSHATESVASRLGDTIGALLNVTFGNAVELIIFIIALVKNEIRIVQASLLGSILSNLLLILGMAFFLGGLRFREQIYNSTVTQMSACLLSLAVTSLLLPTAFHASFNDLKVADEKVLQVSRGVSVILLLVYALYLVFQLNSHAYIYESTPQHIIEREARPGPAAGYFASSSSSESETSSSSDGDSSDSSSSGGTRKRIRRVMKGRRHHGKHKDPADDAEQQVDDDEAAHADLVITPGEPPADEGAAAQEGEASNHHQAPKKERRKKKRHGKKRRAAAAAAETDEDEAMDAVVAVPLEALPQQDGAGTKALDFALPAGGDGANVDVEAQVVTAAAAAASPANRARRLFMRPALSQTLSQSVFAKPPQQQPRDGSASPMPPGGAQQQQPHRGPYFWPGPARGLSGRRTNSMPAHLDESQYYAGAPGGYPPITPVLVSTLSRGPGGTDGGDDGGGEAEEPHADLSRTSAVILLLGSTALVALCAEFMVSSIDAVVEGNSGISEAFIGLILLPIVGNAAEHVTAVSVAMKNKMDLAIGVAVGSSIQIAIFVTPLVVLLGWILNKDMSLYFTLFETVSMFVSAFIVNFLVLDGRSNYLEGALLISAYVIIAVAAFFYPSSEETSSLGGGEDLVERSLLSVGQFAARWLT